jgi:uncharacterized protein (DUF1330 family)
MGSEHAVGRRNNPNIAAVRLWGHQRPDYASAKLQGSKDMNRQISLGLAMLAGVVIGATAIQGLHAQAKPSAYIVIPILKMNDAAGFKAGVVDKVKLEDLAAAGGQYVVRSEKFTSLDGAPPVRLVILKFDGVEKARAFANTAAQKEVNAARIKSTDSLSFIVEGVSN